VFITYIDESGERGIYIYTALSIYAERWHDCLDILKNHRKILKKEYGISIYKELHATELMRGCKISDTVISKRERAAIYKNTISILQSIPDIHIFNSITKTDNPHRLLERLVNRINRTMKEWGTFSILIFDEGDNHFKTKLTRKMMVYNPIPSRYSSWLDTGTTYKNIPIKNIIEDPVFKNSDASYYLQLVDLIAYALLRKEKPLESKTKYGVHQFFDILDEKFVKAVNPNDPQGIIRL